MATSAETAMLSAASPKMPATSKAPLRSKGAIVFATVHPNPRQSLSFFVNITTNDKYCKAPVWDDRQPLPKVTSLTNDRIRQRADRCGTYCQERHSVLRKNPPSSAAIDTYCWLLQSFRDAESPPNEFANGRL